MTKKEQKVYDEIEKIVRAQEGQYNLYDIVLKYLTGDFTSEEYKAVAKIVDIVLSDLKNGKAIKRIKGSYSSTIYETAWR